MDEQLKKRIASIANQTEIANRLGHKPQAVQQWLKKRIPPQKVIPVCVALSWQVTPHELRPDLYPNPSDAMPRTGTT